jgi:2-amino-4-hydroxy-6-hydroxymethyldihydropteridine diphosphokinase
MCAAGFSKSGMNKVYLLTGSNSGDRTNFLSDALLRVGKNIGKVEAHSSIYETQPWGNTDQPAFLNQVLLAATEKNAREVLRSILEIEAGMGRVRKEKWEQRIIDIDILFFNEQIIEEEGLVVPHPFIQERRFALVPMNEIAPALVHPVLQKSIRELLHICPDVLEVKRSP